jgi:glycosyltransferase involved in cell wall biosynthesis
MAAQLDGFVTQLSRHAPKSWSDISDSLDDLRGSGLSRCRHPDEPIDELARQGVAFITYDYGIDGVSIEIGKYAECLEELLSIDGVAPPIHFIGGDFHSQAEAVIETRWHRCRIEGINGWDKWDGGRWFARLYSDEMVEGSVASDELAEQMWSQAVCIARKLARYLCEHRVGLLIAVNVASNPGNLAFTLALVQISEGLGLYTLSSNHDFYWENGRPSADRDPGEPPGVRDHFFRNMANQPFFSLFERLYPWNGERWLQVNINGLQSKKLVQRYGFGAAQVRELSTSISNAFLEEYGPADVISARLRMGHILSDGQAIVRSTALAEHERCLGDWMAAQHPVMLGVREGLSVDPTDPRLIILLQPTRVVARKRIERNLELVAALLRRPAFRNAFCRDQPHTLVLHITGPTPIEHQADLEIILRAYAKVLADLPAPIAERIFVAFSVGREDHHSFAAKGFEPLSIEQIYRIATCVVFPSETEGRGLPLIESSAAGVPIIASRYEPEAVYADVVGEGRPDGEEIDVIPFAPAAFSDHHLDSIAALLLDPTCNADRAGRNREAVRRRYGQQRLVAAFGELLSHLKSLPSR